MNARTTRTLASLLLATLAIFAARPIAAQGPGIPQLLNYQGVLTTDGRVVVADGSYSVTFLLYDVATAGAPIWQETVAVTTIDGVFEATLGLSTPISLPFDAQYWLALSVDGGPEMTPRFRFTATPYAMNALRAATAGALDASATGIVRSVNGIDGDVTIVGSGIAVVTESGSTITVTVPEPLPSGASDGDVIRFDATSGLWQPVPLQVATSDRIAGDGSSAAPLDIAPMGASNGDLLVFDATTGAWRPERPTTVTVTTEAPLEGTGTSADPVGIVDGTVQGMFLFWNGTDWTTTGATAPSEGSVPVWNNAQGTWSPGESHVTTTAEITGDGTTASPIRLAQQGATAGQILRYDATAGAFVPGPSVETANPPLAGDGSSADPLRLVDGGTLGRILYWDGTAWTLSAPGVPSESWVLRWNGTSNSWEPGVVAVGDLSPLTAGAIWYGNASDTATELPIGPAGSLLSVDAAGAAPEWSRNIDVDSIDAVRLAITGDGTIGADLTVAGDVDLADGVIDNDELANGWIRLTYTDGISGGDSVALGDTLSLENTGVRTIAGGLGIGVDTTRGDVTITNEGVRTAAAGQGIEVDTTAGDVMITNAGVRTLTGGTGIGVDTTRGDVTITNEGVRMIAAGPGIEVDTTTGDVTITNTGVRTLTGGTGIGVDTTRGDVTITNEGVRMIAAGDGIEVDTTTGDVTITNAGVRTLTGGTGIGVDTTRGDVTITNEGVRMIAAGPGIEVDTTTGDVTITNAGVRTLTGGIGIGVDTTRGDVTITNEGVRMIAAGSGIGIDTTTGDVTITNAGVRTLTAGAGIGIDTATGDVTITNEGVRTLTGTVNRIIVDTTRGDVTLTAPQDIDSAATPVFAGATFTNLLSGSSSDTVLVATNGQLETRTTASLLAGLGGWRLTGNDGTNPATNFIGTTDSVAFEIRLNDSNTTGINGSGRVFRFTPTANSPNILGGYQGNSIGAGIEGATISGGGQTSDSNVVNDEYSTIGGGYGNEISGSTNGSGLYGRSTIGGGSNNTIHGWQGTIAGGASNRIDANSRDGSIGGGGINHILDNSPFSTIGGGYRNMIRDSVTGGTIAGGLQDSIGQLGHYSTIGGGAVNVIGDGSSYGVIAGGQGNRIDNAADRAFIGGGIGNLVARGAATIGGGTQNFADGPGSFIGGGYRNLAHLNDATIAGGARDTTYGARSFIGSGEANFIDSVAHWTVITGGRENKIGRGSQFAAIGGGLRDTIGAVSSYSRIGGGLSNVIGDTAVYNVIAGGRENRIDSGADFVVIGGGWSSEVHGTGSFVGAGRQHVIDTDHSSIVGGIGNRIGDDGGGAFIGGGFQNLASNFDAIVVGGWHDTTYGYRSFVGGGMLNYIDSANAMTAIVGGYGNRIQFLSPYAFIGGGRSNTIADTASYSTISGGVFHYIGRNSSYATIAGGYGDTIGVSSDHSVISGGRENMISDTSFYSTIGGGWANTIDGKADHATVSGGWANRVSDHGAVVGGGTRNLVASQYAVIAGGISDTTRGYGTFIGSGYRNYIDSATYGAIVAGTDNRIEKLSPLAFIGAGGSNTIDSSAAGVIAAGSGNTVNNAAYSAIVGGLNNVLDGASLSTVLGGDGLTFRAINAVGFQARSAGNNSLPMTITQSNVAVLGNVDLWLANNDNAPSEMRFYEAYNATGAFPNTANYISFEAPAALATSDRYILPPVGAVGQQLTITAIGGGGITLGWAAASDMTKKTDFLPLSGEDILRQFRTLELGSWRYDPSIDPEGLRHYGIMAQDFNRAFGHDALGAIGTDTTVTNIDLHGVSYLAIQGLEERTADQAEEIERLKRENEELKRRLESIEERL